MVRSVVESRGLLMSGYQWLVTGTLKKRQCGVDPRAVQTDLPLAGEIDAIDYHGD